MIVSVTGSAKSVTNQQLDQFTRLIEQLKPTEFHHGDCICADDEAANIVFALGYNITTVHPPVKEDKRAFNKHYAKMLPAKEYIPRDRDLAEICDVLIALPRTKEVIRSGTWATVRHAEKYHKKLYKIFPDGHIEN